MSARRMLRSRTQRSQARGFTLTELMAIIVIISVLSAVGVAAFRRQLGASKTVEASTVIRAIAAAEERYRTETMQYLGPSADLEDYFPMTAPDATTKYEWHQTTHSDWLDWQLLNVTVPGPVQFGYAVVAGPPGVAPPNPSVTQKTILWSPPADIRDPWYVIQAKGFTEGSDVFSLFVASSFTSDIYSEEGR